MRARGGIISLIKKYLRSHHQTNRRPNRKLGVYTLVSPVVLPLFKYVSHNKRGVCVCVCVALCSMMGSRARVERQKCLFHIYVRTYITLHGI